MTAAATVLRAIDAAARRPLLVFGSLPPGGRDLDLLVRDGDGEPVAAALDAAGAIRRGRAWALFAGGGAYAVELVPAAAWRLPPGEVDALFAQAEPVAGYEALVRPSAAHTLLILARIGVTDKRRARLADALAEPGAREEAERRAHAWRVSLDALGAPPARRPPLRAPRVVALSGLDGSGKSTQARAVAATLTQLGYEAHVVWSPILQNRSVALLSSLARVLLRRSGRRSAGGGDASLVAQVEASTPSRRALRLGWTTLVALVNAWSYRRPALVHRGSETVLVYDRFLLDSIVRIRFLYGRGERFELQRALLRLLTPRAVAAFWLDVPPQRAYARKPEHWDVDDLTAQSELYREEHAALGVRRLDGERPRKELTAEIAAEIWRRL